MKLLAALIASALLLSACATGKSYSIRSDLQDDPGSKTELIFKTPVRDAFPILRDMSTACFDTRQTRTTSERPDNDGRGGSITLTTVATFQQSRILVTTKLDPIENRWTRVTIYYFGDAHPEGIVARYRRWLEDGSKTCSNSPP